MIYGFQLLDIDQDSSYKQAEMTPAKMSLDSALNNTHVTAEQNPVLEETKASQRSLVSILNIIQIPVEQNAVEPNPIVQNINEQVPPIIPVAELPYGMVALSNVNEAQLNQLGDPAVSSSTGKNIMVVNEEALQQIPLPPMLNEGQENASTKPLITGEGNQEIQLDYNQNVSTIEVPLITDPNSTPELVKFRPGIYEGDATPPVYSNFSIFAVDEYYVPQMPASVQPNMSIIPEPIYEEQVITENETTNDTEKLIESGGNNFVVDNQKHPLAVENAQISEQPIKPRLTGLSGGRIVDARLLVTLRNTRLILIYKGYHFKRYYFQGLKIRWQCVDQKCSAYLYSYENKVTVVYSVHDHLGILRENHTPKKPTELKSVYSLEEAINAVTGLGVEKDKNADPSVLVAPNMETMTLSYTNETATQTSPPPKENIFPSRLPYVFCSKNTKIYHDPSLEITVKDSSDLQENDNTHAMFSGSENTITSLPDPLDYCVTSYEPTSPQNNAGSSHQDPKDVKAKVTLTSIPQISKPQVYYDGKLAEPTTDQIEITNSNEFISTATWTMSSTNPVTTYTLPALSSSNLRDAAFIPRARAPPLSSQIINKRSARLSRGNISLSGITTPLRVLETYARSSKGQYKRK